ncbi:hypothetical protein B484DRAFT_450644, partial [Ochromonadaceae sp. CCMP2298]
MEMMAKMCGGLGVDPEGEMDEDARFVRELAGCSEAKASLGAADLDALEDSEASGSASVSSRSDGGSIIISSSSRKPTTGTSKSAGKEKTGAASTSTEKAVAKQSSGWKKGFFGKTEKKRVTSAAPTAAPAPVTVVSTDAPTTPAMHTVGTTPKSMAKSGANPSMSAAHQQTSASEDGDASNTSSSSNAGAKPKAAPVAFTGNIFERLA